MVVFTFCITYILAHHEVHQKRSGMIDLRGLPPFPIRKVTLTVGMEEFWRNPMT
jgi:hypothetical protein